MPTNDRQMSLKIILAKLKSCSFSVFSLNSGVYGFIRFKFSFITPTLFDLVIGDTIECYGQIGQMGGNLKVDCIPYANLLELGRLLHLTGCFRRWCFLIRFILRRLKSPATIITQLGNFASTSPSEWGRWFIR